jgi:hypothetical protein
VVSPASRVRESVGVGSEGARVVDVDAQTAAEPTEAQPDRIRWAKSGVLQRVGDQLRDDELSVN